MEEEELCQRLADLRELAGALNPGRAEDELGCARIEAYQAGMQFAVDYLEHGATGEDVGEAEVIPFPRQ